MIEIKISGKTPLEALASLTAFGIHCMTDETVAAAANHILEAERSKAAQVSNSDTPANPQAPADLEAPTPAPRTMSAEESRAMVEAARAFNPGAGNRQAPADLPPEPYVEDPPHGDPTPRAEPEPAGDDAPTYTLEQIRARGTEAARTHGTPAVKAILTELGAKGMGTLDKSKYSAFMAKLDALEGQGGPNA